MATKTAGTLSTTTLTAVQFSYDRSASGLTDTDLATIANEITRDNVSLAIGADGGGNKVGVTGASIQPAAVTRQGLVTLPGGRNDTPLEAYPGDWIATDGFGNVFVIPQRAMPKTLTLANCTTANGSPALVFPSSILALGWQNGTHVTGTNIPSGCVLGDISPNGLAANLYTFSTGAKANATGSASNVTVTAGTFTHS